MCTPTTVKKAWTLSHLQPHEKQERLRNKTKLQNSQSARSQVYDIETRLAISILQDVKHYLVQEKEDGVENHGFKNMTSMQSNITKALQRMYGPGTRADPTDEMKDPHSFYAYGTTNETAPNTRDLKPLTTAHLEKFKRAHIQSHLKRWIFLGKAADRKRPPPNKDVPISQHPTGIQQNKLLTHQNQNSHPHSDPLHIMGSGGVAQSWGSQNQNQNKRHSQQSHNMHSIPSQKTLAEYLQSPEHHSGQTHGRFHPLSHSHSNHAPWNLQSQQHGADHHHHHHHGHGPGAHHHHHRHSNSHSHGHSHSHSHSHSHGGFGHSSEHWNHDQDEGHKEIDNPFFRRVRHHGKRERSITRKEEEQLLHELSFRLQQEYLSKKTHFGFDEIIGLQNMFRLVTAKCNPPGEMDPQFFREYMRNTFSITHDVMLDQMFKYFDAENNGSICETEWIRALSTFLRGTLDDQINFCYFVYDLNGDGGISRAELKMLIQDSIQDTTFPGGLPSDETFENIREFIDVTMKILDTRKTGVVTKECFRIAVNRDPLMLQCLGHCLPEASKLISFFALLTENFKFSTNLCIKGNEDYGTERVRYNVMEYRAKYARRPSNDSKQIKVKWDADSIQQGSSQQGSSRKGSSPRGPQNSEERLKQREQEQKRKQQQQQQQGDPDKIRLSVAPPPVPPQQVNKSESERRLSASIAEQQILLSDQIRVKSRSQISISHASAISVTLSGSESGSSVRGSHSQSLISSQAPSRTQFLSESQSLVTVVKSPRSSFYDVPELQLQ